MNPLLPNPAKEWVRSSSSMDMRRITTLAWEASRRYASNECFSTYKSHGGLLYRAHRIHYTKPRGPATEWCSCLMLKSTGGKEIGICSVSVRNGMVKHGHWHWSPRNMRIGGEELGQWRGDDRDGRLIRSDDSISSTRTSLIHFLEHSYHSTPLAG